jgi:hypothetical protein
VYSEKHSLYFTNKCHKENYEKMLNAFPDKNRYSEYRCAIYTISIPEVYNKFNGKTGKYPFLWAYAVEEVITQKYCEEDGEYSRYEIKVLREKTDGSADYSDAYYSLSRSYKSIINLAEELFYSKHNGFEVIDAIGCFDHNLYKVFMQLLQIRREGIGMRGLDFKIQ